MGQVHKASPDEKFTKVSNDLIRDRSVEDCTFRFICWVFSHKDGFSVSFAGITQAFGYGKDKIKRLIKNAEQNDYLVRIKSQNPKTGLFDWDYFVFATKEQAISFKNETPNVYTAPKPTSKPGGENPPMDKEVNQGGLNQGMVNPGYGEHPPHKKTNNSFQEKKTKRKKDSSSSVVSSAFKILEKEEAKQAATKVESVEVLETIEAEIVDSISQNQQSHDFSKTIESEDSTYSLTIPSLRLDTSCGYGNDNNSLENDEARRIQALANNPRKLSWMSSAATFRDEMISAVYESGKKHFSLAGGKGMNKPHINRYLKKLLTTAQKGSANEVISSWNELIAYWEIAVQINPESQTPEVQAAKQYFDQKRAEERAKKRKEPIKF